MTLSFQMVLRSQAMLAHRREWEAISGSARPRTISTVITCEPALEEAGEFMRAGEPGGRGLGGVLGCLHNRTGNDRRAAWREVRARQVKRRIVPSAPDAHEA